MILFFFHEEMFIFSLENQSSYEDNIRMKEENLTEACHGTNFDVALLLKLANRQMVFELS